MPGLRHLALVRHGETVENSAERLIGRSDAPLSEEGRSQIAAARLRLAGEMFDLVVASPQRRAWQSAWLLAAGAPVRIEADFREIDFGRWEGLTPDEIERRDPVLAKDWRSRAEGFEYPGGEQRVDFHARIARGVQRLRESGARSVLVAAHKGVIRRIVEDLTGGRPGDESLELGAVLFVTRDVEGRWFLGRHASVPASVAATKVA